MTPQLPPDPSGRPRRDLRALPAMLLVVSLALGAILLPFYGAILWGAIMAVLFTRVPGSLVPDEDQGYVINAYFLPPAASVDRTDALTHDFTEQLMQRPAVEDVVTTGESVRKAIRAAEARGGVLVGVGAIVDRSGGRAAFGVPFRALLALEVPQYPEEACPLCREGVPLEEV